MASSVSQLQLVRGLAQGRERKLAAEVGELMSQKASATATVHRLQEYLREYQAEEVTRGARSVMDIENERSFVKRLTLALDQQQQHLRHIDDTASSRMQSWHREHANLQALDRLLSQRARAQSRLQDRYEQKETDAFSARAINDGVQQ